MPKVETQIVDGITFRRYPNSRHRHHRVYWQAHTGGRASVIYLHRYLWERANGPIPEGYHVHHVDENPLNNAVDNLECVSPAEHVVRHGEAIKRYAQSDEQLYHLDAVRPLAAAWHRSEEGLAWHSENGKRAWENRQWYDKACESCGSEFRTPFPERARFCSPTCGHREWERTNKRPSRYKRLGPPEPRNCEWCGEQYQPVKRTKRSFCSVRCRNFDAHARRKGHKN